MSVKFCITASIGHCTVFIERQDLDPRTRRKEIKNERVGVSKEDYRN